MAEGGAQVIEHLPSKGVLWVHSPVPQKEGRKRKREGGERERERERETETETEERERKKERKRSWAPVAHTCNPSYSGGRD
jgi:hypothetical protein